MEDGTGDAFFSYPRIAKVETKGGPYINKYGKFINTNKASAVAVICHQLFQWLITLGYLYTNILNMNEIAVILEY